MTPQAMAALAAKHLLDAAAIDRRKVASAEAYRSTPHGQPVVPPTGATRSITSARQRTLPRSANSWPDLQAHARKCPATRGSTESAATLRCVGRDPAIE